MKKLLFAGLLLAAAGAGAWFLTQDKAGVAAPADNDLLTYVPADTIFFSGSLEPLPTEQYVNLMQQYGIFSDGDLMLQAGAEADPSAPAGVKLLTALYHDYLGAMADPEMLREQFGFADPVNMAAYTVGVVPVLRIALADEGTFAGLLDSHEQKLDIAADQETLQGTTYRSYALSEEPEMQGYRLIVGHHEGYMVMALDTPLEDSVDLAPALGAVKPAASLAGTDTLTALAAKYDYLASNLTYLDHVAIAEGITRPESNGFGQMLSALLRHHGDQNPFAGIQNESCHADITGLVGNWPRLVAGNTTLDDDGMSGSIILEGANPELLRDLAKIRGHIPDAIMADDFAFSFALGLKMDAIAPYLTKVWRDFTTATYQCEPLVAMQASAKESNPAMLGAMTGMMSGVRGVAIGLMDLELEETVPGAGPQPKSADLVVTFTVEDPQAFLSVMAMMQPALAELAIEDGGEPVTLPDSLATGLDVKIAQRGQNLIVYTGPGSAGKLPEFAGSPDPEANGLMAFSMNATKYFGFLSQVLDSMPEGTIEQEERQTLEKLKNMKGFFSSSLDVTDEGVISTMDMQMAE